MRKSWDECFMNVAKEYASMSTCIRRHVGCVLVDEFNFPLSMGFNGPPSGWDHCDPASSRRKDLLDIYTCPGADAPAGLTDRGSSTCFSNHSEANALLNCPDKRRIKTCYTTTSPCSYCIKLLLVTNCTRIVFLEEYPGKESMELWTRKPLILPAPESPKIRTWEKLTPNGAVLIASSTSMP